MSTNAAYCTMLHHCQILLSLLLRIPIYRSSPNFSSELLINTSSCVGGLFVGWGKKKKKNQTLTPAPNQICLEQIWVKPNQTVLAIYLSSGKTSPVTPTPKVKQLAHFLQFNKLPLFSIIPSMSLIPFPLLFQSSRSSSPNIQITELLTTILHFPIPLFPHQQNVPALFFSNLIASYSINQTFLSIPRCFTIYSWPLSNVSLNYMAGCKIQWQDANPRYMERWLFVYVRSAVKGL